MVENIVVWNEI